MNLPNWLARSAAATPARPALATAEAQLSYAELERRAASAARRLAALGAAPGARVALVLEHSLEQVVLLHGLVKLGAVAVPLDPGLGDRALEERIERSDARVVVRDVAEVLSARERDVTLATVNASDAAHCVIFTSGTEGRPKPVELTYGNHAWSAFGSAARIGVHADDRWLCCLPLHHIGGLAIVLRSAIYGTTAVVERFDGRQSASLIDAGTVTLVSLVGTMLRRLLEAGAELGRLRCALVGGGPLAPTLIDTALEAGAPIAPTYGLTETASQVTTLPPGETAGRPGSMGPPLLPTDVRIDSDGTILVRGPTVAPAAAGGDGWLRTGDRGRLGDDGHLYVVGRGDDVIVTGGENVVPETVESVLLAHPAVDDAAVTGRADEEWGRVLVATVVLSDGAGSTEDELRDFCRERLAGFQVPKRIEFARALPRDSQGKLRLRELLG